MAVGDGHVVVELVGDGHGVELGVEQVLALEVGTYFALLAVDHDPADYLAGVGQELLASLEDGDGGGVLAEVILADVESFLGGVGQEGLGGVVVGQ